MSAKQHKAKEEETTHESKREPIADRMVSGGQVRVRALGPIGENGFHAKGEEFEVSEERAKALGPLVERVK